MSSPAGSPLARIEGHYRRALTKRWFELNVRALVYTATVTAIATLVLSSSLKTFFISLPVGALTYPITVYPILAARRSLITSPPKLAPKTSLSTILLSSFTSPHTLYYLAANVTFGATFSSVYCFLVALGNPSREFGLWSSTPRHPWHLNERYIFLVLGNSLLFLVLGIRDVLLHETAAEWPRKKTALWLRAREAIMSPLPINVSAAWCVGYSLTYFVLRRAVWRFFLVHFGGVMRLFVVNYLKSSRSNITWSLIIHLLLLGCTSIAVLWVPSAVVNAYVTHPLNFDPFLRKSALPPDRYLLAALKSQNPYHLHFTLMEVRRIVHNPARRKAIFNDISQSPPLTHQIWQGLLLHLGRTNYALVTRGGSRPLTASPAPRSAPAPDPRAIPIKQADIFRPAVKKPSTFGLSLLDGPVRAMPPEQVLRAAQKTVQIEGKAAEQVKQLQGRALEKIEGTETGHKVLDEAQSRLSAVYEWAGEDWAGRSVERSLPDREIIQHVIDVIATLTVASAEEDTYGHVQQVLPATLEAIIRFRSTVASFQSELLAQSALLGRGQAAAQSEVIRRCGPTSIVCETGIKRIGEKFGKSLSAFRFPPSIASTLTEICRRDPQQEASQGSQQEK